MGASDYFSGMEGAKAQAGGAYFKGEGKYELTLKRMFVNVGHKGKFFIAEFGVDSSSNDDDPIGCTRSWATPLTGERAGYSFGDIKNLIFSLLGKEPKDVGDPSDSPKLHAEATTIVKAACDPEYAKKEGLDPTLLIGRNVGLETFKKQTKPKIGQEKGGLFTVHRWSPV